MGNTTNKDSGGETAVTEINLDQNDYNEPKESPKSDTNIKDKDKESEHTSHKKAKKKRKSGKKKSSTEQEEIPESGQPGEMKTDVRATTQDGDITGTSELAGSEDMTDKPISEPSNQTSESGASGESLLDNNSLEQQIDAVETDENGHSSDPSSRTKQKKKVLSFPKKKTKQTESSNKKDKKKRKSSTEELKNQELPDDKQLEAQKNGTSSEQLQNEAQSDDITNEAAIVMSQIEEQSDQIYSGKKPPTDIQNSNDKGEEITCIDHECGTTQESSKGNNGKESEQKTCDGIKEKRRKSRFKFKKQKRDKTAINSDAQENGETEELDQSGANQKQDNNHEGTTTEDKPRKWSKESNKIEQNPKEIEEIEEDQEKKPEIINDKTKDKTKDKEEKRDEKKKRRHPKCAKIYPMDYIAPSQTQNDTHNESHKDSDGASVSGSSNDQLDNLIASEKFENCALIIPHTANDVDTKEEQNKSSNDVRNVDALKLLTLPSPPWVLNDFVDEVEEPGFINSHQLSNKMSDGALSPFKNDPSALLILDTRDEVTYDQRRIFNSKHAATFMVQVNEPSDSSQISEQISEIWPKLEDYTQIILYDENGLTLSLTDSILSQTMDHLESKGLKPLILKGGYKDFHMKFPFICVHNHDNDNSHDEDNQCGNTDNTTNDILHYPSVILNDQLYLGRGDQATNENVIKNLGIAYIVNISTEHPNAFEDKVTYFNIAVKDEPTVDLQNHFLKVIQFIHNALQGGGHVFVHCNLGASRSAAVVIAYLMMTKKWTAADAAKYVVARRPLISLNRGFIKQLKSFEKKLFGKNAKTGKNLAKDIAQLLL